MAMQSTCKTPQSPQWIAICTTNSVQEAHIVAGKLNASDIPSMIHQEPGAAALGITLGHLGEVKVLIDAADYEKAAAILLPDDSPQLEANTDKFQLIWRDDGDGAAYYVEDEDDE